ncbi:MAG TPA: outer membrane beta-barrel protein [Gemmatimonadaceae bacterium]|nr:outer membrane beta-barrel protein [Gemmatimonadaceae bacterium]
MKRFLSMHTMSLALAALALTVATSSAEAQRPKIGISGGVSVPNGDLADGTKTGYNVNLGVEFKPPVFPLGIRVEGLLNQLSGEEIDFGGESFAIPDLRVLGGTANVVYQFPGIAVKPYLIGGVGMYNSKLKGADEGSTDFGINGGVGLKFSLGAIETYAEARMHNIFGEGDGSARIIPISFGILF